MIITLKVGSVWIEPDVETMLCRFKSIPAFTANLTMENFQKQTRC